MRKFGRKIWSGNLKNLVGHFGRGALKIWSDILSDISSYVWSDILRRIWLNDFDPHGLILVKYFGCFSLMCLCFFLCLHFVFFCPLPLVAVPLAETCLAEQEEVNQSKAKSSLAVARRRTCLDSPSKKKQSKAEWSKPKQGKAKQSKTKQSKAQHRKVCNMCGFRGYGMH